MTILIELDWIRVVEEVMYIWLNFIEVHNIKKKRVETAIFGITDIEYKIYRPGLFWSRTRT